VATSCGNAFQARAAVTGKARSPIVGSRVADTTTVVAEAEHNLCRCLRSDTRVNSSDKYVGQSP